MCSIIWGKNHGEIHDPPDSGTLASSLPQFIEQILRKISGGLLIFFGLFLLASLKIPWLNWATHCPPCRSEMAYLESAFKDYADQGVVVLAADTGESLSKVREFVEIRGLSFPVVLESQGDVAKSLDKIID